MRRADGEISRGSSKESRMKTQPTFQRHGKSHASPPSPSLSPRRQAAWRRAQCRNLPTNRRTRRIVTQAGTRMQRAPVYSHNPKQPQAKKASRCDRLVPTMAEKRESGCDKLRSYPFPSLRPGRSSFLALRLSRHSRWTRASFYLPLWLSCQAYPGLSAWLVLKERG